jgi:hypothetical protein
MASVENIEQNTLELKEQLQQSLDKLDSTFKLIVNTTETQTPRVFCVLPDPSAKSWKRPKTWGHNTFKLHLMCEYDGWHFTEDRGYPITQPNEMLRKTAPYLKWVLTGLGAAWKVKGKVAMVMGSDATVSDKTDDRISSGIEKAQALLGGLQDPMSDFGGLAAQLSQFEDNPNAEPDAKAVLGPALRELETFLMREDTIKRYGGLHRVCYPSGDVVWLCDHHKEMPEPGKKDGLGSAKEDKNLFAEDFQGGI